MHLDSNQIIGKGSNSLIWLNEEKNKAIKKIKINKFGYENILEIVIGKSIKHIGICPIEDIFFFDDGIYFSMPIADCDLKEYVKRKKLSESEILDIFCILIYALNHLHKNNIIHGDIKPSNILMFNDIPKISDFGSSVLTFGNKCRQSFCTRYYRSPEMWQNEWSKEADIWALACTIYEIKYSKVLFPIKHEGFLNFEEWKKTSLLKLDNFLDNILLQMLEIDPKKRITLEKIISILENQSFENRTEYSENINEIEEIAKKIDFSIDTKEAYFSLAKILDYSNNLKQLNLNKLLDVQKKLFQQLVNIMNKE